MDRRRYLRAVSVGGAFSLAGCVGGSSTAGTSSVKDATLTLATATTTHDSGLLDELLPVFEDRLGVEVDTIARGTGGALQTARNGDCDLVIVHARPLEDEFLRSGHGTNRRRVMVNDFLVVGPPDDPANIAGKDAVAAFEAIARADATFLSRGDLSGTHLRERHIWGEAGIDPDGTWYSETGQGMGNTLLLAGQTGAYCLSDRGTFLNVSEDTLVAHVDYGIENPAMLLRNEYAVIPVNPARHDVAYPLAMALVGYLTGSGQSQIDEFRIAGEQAFRPLELSQEPAFEQYVPSDWRTESNT